MTAAPTTDLGTTAARAVAWNYVSFAAGKVLVLATMAILARLLTPEDFGIVGFATLAVGYLAVLRDLGLGAAVIQRREDTEESAQTVFVINLVLGFTLTGLTYLLAPLVADFFREPVVTPLLRLLSVTFILESLGSIHVVLLKRNLAFRRKLVPDVGRAAVKGAVSIGTAIAGAGAWALVFGQLAGVLAAVILSWAVMPWRPRFQVHRRLIRPLMRFGGPLVLTDIQYALWTNLDYIVVGRMLGDVALGVYTLAYRLPELLIQDDAEQLRRAFLATIRYTQLLVVPLSLGLLITADPAVKVLFGDQWHAAIPVLQVLAVFSLIGSIGVNAGDVYKALGRPDVLVRLSAFELTLLIPALIYCSRWGLIGVAWAHAGVAIIDSAVRLVVAARMVGFDGWDVWRQLRPSAYAGAWLAAATLGAGLITAGLGPLSRLAAMTAAGGVTYCLALWRFDREAVLRVLGWVGLKREAHA